MTQNAHLADAQRGKALSEGVEPLLLGARRVGQHNEGLAVVAHHHKAHVAVVVQHRALQCVCQCVRVQACSRACVRVCVCVCACRGGSAREMTWALSSGRRSRSACGAQGRSGDHGGAASADCSAVPHAARHSEPQLWKRTRRAHMYAPLRGTTSAACSLDPPQPGVCACVSCRTSSCQSDRGASPFHTPDGAARQRRGVQRRRSAA
jgi:hypothetical protein